MPGPSLVPTGERTAPGLPDEEYWFARHEVAYRWIAARLAPTGPDRGGFAGAPGRVVVDAGAGEGYGAALLTSALPAATVIALEYDMTACAHMRHTYGDVVVINANLAALPLRSASVDAITCLQVVEHLWDLPGYLRECRRALRPGGELIVTTPQRLTFSPGLARGEKPVNPWHVEEFDAEQLRDLLAATGFDDVRMRGVHHGSRLAEWEARHGSLVAAQVEASLSGAWPSGLRDAVREATHLDFEIDADPLPASGERMARAQDLLAVARCAS